MTWHILDAGSIWIKEFAVALTKRASTPVRAWVPRMSLTGLWQNWEMAETLIDPPVSLRWFPLQRGYARQPMSWLVRLGPTLAGRLGRQSDDLAGSTLVCTTPYYAPVAERWPGPVIYYQTDMTVAYAGADPSLVRRLDRKLCRRADLVCPNSARIAAYFRDLGCPAGKIEIVPNATRESNLLPEPALRPVELPADAADLPRPVVGVIGNLAANMDWLYLEQLVARTPRLSWLFVGPYGMDVPDPAQRAARSGLLRHGGRVRFVGSRPYGVLKDYARAFDAAVLPYRKSEPTYSGSSTRFYEHLPACRPMLATRGFEELLHKEPLVALADTAEESAAILARWETLGFRDGHEESRWQASRVGTWETRAETMIDALANRPASRPHPGPVRRWTEARA